MRNPAIVQLDQATVSVIEFQEDCQEIRWLPGGRLSPLGRIMRKATKKHRAKDEVVRKLIIGRLFFFWQICLRSANIGRFVI